MNRQFGFLFLVIILTVLATTACNTTTPTPIPPPQPSPSATNTSLPAATQTSAPIPTLAQPTVGQPTVGQPTSTVAQATSTGAPANPTAVRPTNTAVPQPQAQRITFPPNGTSVTLSGVIAAGAINRYVLKAQAGQTMNVKVTSPGDQVILIIFGADGDVLISDHAGATTWSGKLPTTQDYIIDLRSVGSTAANYVLQVTIPPLGPTSTPQPQAKRITFPPGATSVTVKDNIGASGFDQHVIAAQAGQTMKVNVTSPGNNVILVIFGADGNVLISDHATTMSWSGTLPTTQDYFIQVKSFAGISTSYTLQVIIPARITFAPGAISKTVAGTITDGLASYLVNARGGQTMTVNVTSSPPPSVILVIYGADGNVLISDHAEATTWTGTLPSTQDYFIDLKSFAGQPANFTLQVTIPP